MMLILVILLILGTAILLSLALFPPLFKKADSWRVKKEATVSKEFDNMFYNKNPKHLVNLYFILPLVFGLLGFFLSNSVWGVGAGVLLGLFIPSLILRMRDAKRRQKFDSQILDAIMVLSSSLKGGLSLLQAFEVLQEELPPPISQEIGLVIKENKMGVSLEQSLTSLNKRMHIEDLELVVSSILVARETGGDLTRVFSRLATTIRDNRKLRDNIKTLTMQGKMQGIIMSILPFFFIWWVITFNREHFEIMLTSEIGRILLFVAVFLQIVGIFLIKKFSTIKV